MKGTAKLLGRRGVLGINRRNIDYVMRCNPRKLYPLVDDKLLTKRLMIEHEIAVPDLYGVFETQHAVHGFAGMIEDRCEFVIKPAHGSQGDGILVIKGRKNGRFRTAGGDMMGEGDVKHHISNTLSGQYSLGGNRDCALIEYCVQSNPVFEKISYQGVPDIRVIVYLGYPVMAMARLPTRLSGGKANLHQGAVGAGIDLQTGVTLEGVMENEPVVEHPDTENPIAGVEIPDWHTILMLAARCADVTRLGYLGVDIVLDRELGALVLELNARPGLSIQIANQRGLLPRLGTVTDLESVGTDIADRVAFSREAFAHQALPLGNP